jgi:hypothetical protein
MKETQQTGHLKMGNDRKKDNTQMNWINHEQSERTIRMLMKPR